jgi:tetratricopeptide (TPR) repeat protein
VVEFSNPGAARLFLANSSCTGRDRLAVAERGYSLRYTDPAAMLAWCEAAVVNLPDSLPPSERGILLGHLGNAHRVLCNFTEAEVYLRQAHAAAPDNPQILEFYASLMKDKRHLDSAAEFLARSASLRRGSGDNTGHSRTLLNSSLVLDEAGFANQAVDSVLGALEIIGLLPLSEEREHLARAGFQSLATYLVNAGKAKEALWVVRSCKDRLMMGGQVFRLRVEWLLAEISGALGEIDSAVRAYQAVRASFAELGHTQEVAVVTLDLARLLLKSRPLQARQEALSVWPIFDSLGIARDSREAKLLAAVIEDGTEASLVELSTALRSSTLARLRA